jgi:propionyl-CoA carboxylase beta chain
MKEVLKELERRRAARAAAAKPASTHSTARDKLPPATHRNLSRGSFENSTCMSNIARRFRDGKAKVAGDGVVTGWGTVNGRTVFVFPRISPSSAISVGGARRKV